MGISLKTTSGKILASAALVATAAAVAGMGTYGSWGYSTTADQAVTAGTVSIGLGVAGSTNTLSVPISGVLPGDRIERLVTLSNSGTVALNAVTLTTTAGTSSLLTSDTTNGLQLTVESCPVAWTPSTAGYTCSAGQTVLPSAPIIGANRTLAGLKSLEVNGVDNLKFSAVLPGTAPGTFQGASSTVSFAFTATQRTAKTL